MNKKGIIYTLDSMLALATLMIALLSVLYIFKTSNDSQAAGAYLPNIGHDALTILEKDSTLLNSLKGQPGLGIFLDALPYQVCANISIYSEGMMVHTVQKQDCTANDNFNLVTRSFVFADDIYLAQMRLWYK